MLIVLTRTSAAADCCQGELVAGALTLQSIELPWIPAPPGLGGAKGASCVPEGLYQLVRHDTELHPRSFALVNPELDVFHEPADVPPELTPYARVAVLLHVANYPHELQGCIGLGMQKGNSCVFKSAIALQRFNMVVPWMEGHSLRIDSAPGSAP